MRISLIVFLVRTSLLSATYHNPAVVLDNLAGLCTAAVVEGNPAAEEVLDMHLAADHTASFLQNGCKKKKQLKMFTTLLFFSKMDSQQHMNKMKMQSRFQKLNKTKKTQTKKKEFGQTNCS